MIDKTALKRRLIEQKEEAELVLGQSLVKREKQPEFLKILEAPLVKVIMGPRRSGKTVLSLQIRGNNYYYINFDDEILGGTKPEDFNQLLELLSSYILLLFFLSILEFFLNFCILLV